METHGHECVDCQSLDMLELDHNPLYLQTRRTITEELEPRTVPSRPASMRPTAGQSRLRLGAAMRPAIGSSAISGPLASPIPSLAQFRGAG
jgi:hypothetical protein